jgi:outer membrane receptor protein involved in Fe transport
MANWNYNYHPNPYWVALAAENADGRDRVIGNGSVTYELTDWLKVMARSGTDWYQEDRQWNQPAGTFGLFLGRQAEQVGPNGGYEHETRYRQERNSDFLVTANRYVGEHLSAVVNVGGNHRTNEFRNGYTWVRSLVVPGVYNVQNAAETPFSQETLSRKEVNSLYASANFGYRDFLFLDVTGRNDWSSTLPEGNNSYFYPSVGGSFVFSDVMSLPGLTSGKVRASWARVGNDADPYQLASVFVSSPAFVGQPIFSVGNQIANADLKPETTESWEVGTELGFWDGRLSFDGAYYNKATTDQIIGIQVSPTSGYTNQVVNAGRVENHGYEFSATAIPVRTSGGFEWEMQANFGRNFSKVADLTGDLSTVVLGTYWSLNVEARKGEPYGALFGNGYLRDSQGRILVSASGLPRRDPVRRVLGNYNPDWVGSLRNSFRYRGLDLSFMLDTRQGGELFSVTQMFGRYAGVLAETNVGRCVQGGAAGGMPACDASTGIIVPGVKVVAGDTVPNDIAISAENYFHALYGNHEAQIYDASYVKLREATLGYTLPATMTRRLGVSAMNVALIGRNLALWTDVPNIDPETGFDASNVQGLEFGQLPTPRSIGFSVSVTP